LQHRKISRFQQFKTKYKNASILEKADEKVYSSHFELNLVLLKQIQYI